MSMNSNKQNFEKIWKFFLNIALLLRKLFETFICVFTRLKLNFTRTYIILFSSPSLKNHKNHVVLHSGTSFLLAAAHWSPQPVDNKSTSFATWLLSKSLNPDLLAPVEWTRISRFQA